MFLDREDTSLVELWRITCRGQRHHIQKRREKNIPNRRWKSIAIKLSWLSPLTLVCGRVAKYFYLRIYQDMDGWSPYLWYDFSTDALTISRLFSTCLKQVACILSTTASNLNHFDGSYIQPLSLCIPRSTFNSRYRHSLTSLPTCVFEWSKCLTMVAYTILQTPTLGGRQLQSFNAAFSAIGIPPMYTSSEDAAMARFKKIVFH